MRMKASVALERRLVPPDAAVPAQDSRERRFRGLRVGNLGLLVAHDLGGEIIEDANVFPLPRAAAWCRGLINLRGSLIPAFDLHQSLGLMHLRASRQWWLALGSGQDTLAFAVDALPVALQADEGPTQCTQILPDSLRAHVGGTYHINGAFWFEFRHLEFVQSLCSAASGNHLS